MKLMLLAASARKDSCNKKLIQQVARLLKETPHQLDITDFTEFDMPLYDGDTEEKQGVPAGALKFIQRLHAADGLILSSPEYNFSMPGTLKNLIDWVSRVKPMPWINQQILLLSASPALVGGNRGLWHTRVPLESCGAFVFPQMFSLAGAYSAFTPEGELADAQLAKRLQAMLSDFLNYLQKIKGN